LSKHGGHHGCHELSGIGPKLSHIEHLRRRRMRWWRR